MIRSITIKDFKSYDEATLSLAPLTFLIGANASGKSNALEAIRLLSWLAKGRRLDDIDRRVQGEDRFIRGQSAELFFNRTVPISLSCTLTDMPEEWDKLSLSIRMFPDKLIVIDEAITKSDPAEQLPLYKIDGDLSLYTDEVSVMYNNFSQDPSEPHIPCSNQQAIFYQLQSPGRFEEKHHHSQKIIPAVTKRVRETLRQIVFLDPRPTVMRGYSLANPAELEEDGSNLSSVLHRICSDQENGKALLLDFIRSLPEQDISDITFIETPRGEVMVSLVELFGGWRSEIAAPLLSDGTLRVLSVAAALLSAPKGSLVIIEEIDNGVHPSRADMLVRQIQKVAKDRNLRVLLTTHNPALLDSLPDNALGDVLCCYRDEETGYSRIVRLGDMDQYPELIARGTLGELVTNRTLDRYLKDRQSPEDRKQRALQFLKEFRQEFSG